MFSVLISYFLSLFIVFIQVFFLAGGFIVFSTNLHILSSVVLASLIYVISFTYVIPGLVLSRFNPLEVRPEEHVDLFNRITTFQFKLNKGPLKVFESSSAPFIMIGSLLGSKYLLLNSVILNKLDDKEKSIYIDAEMSFNESFSAKILGHILIVFLFWRTIISIPFKLLRGEAVFRYMFVVPRRLFSYLSNSFKQSFFKEKEYDIRGIAQKVIYLENGMINNVHFNVASTTMWSLNHTTSANMDERFHQSELL